ncbi:hypothetical protein JW905_10075, partial [bacterium]|nr:hypothetical protein [candidate division CSSED10-310 bacterium]
MKSTSGLLFAFLVVLAGGSVMGSEWLPVTVSDPAAVETSNTGSGELVTLTVVVPGLAARMVETKAGPYTLVDLGEGSFKGDIGTPRLPVLRRFVEVPYGAAVSLEYDTGAPVVLYPADHDLPARLLPVQPPVPKLPGAAEAAPFVIQESLYAQDRELDGEWVRIQDDDYLRGHRLVVLEISPVRYNPARGTLTVVPEVHIRVRLRNADLVKTASMAARYWSPPFEQLLSSLAVNHGAYRDYSFPPGAPIGYLIICPASLQAGLADFIDWKTQCGYEVTVASAPSGADTTTIKNIILDAYQNWSNPPDYVLLAGDTDTIPQFTGESSGSEDDHQYTELEGTGYWTPDVMIGRFPVRTTIDLSNMVTKILQFQKMTMPSTAYFKDSVWLASDDHYYLIEPTHEYCFDSHVEPLDPSSNTYHAVYERLGGSTSDFASNVNAGRGIVCYSGHGYGNGTGTSSIHFVNSNVQALYNTNMYGNVMVFACGTNLYSQTMSFGECWVLQANKASVSYWGTSDSSYWDEDDTEEREIYRCSHEDLVHTLSAMCLRGLIEVYESGGSAAYYFDIYNLMGDPSTDFVNRIPQTMVVSCDDTAPPEEQDFSVTVTVDGSALEGALAAISMNGVLLGAGYTGSTGIATIHFTPPGTGTATITVTGHNLVPEILSLTVAQGGCGSIDLDSSLYSCADLITITVTDADLDLNSGAIDTAVADIASDSEPTAETVTLTETGVATHIFTGVIQTSATQSGAGYLLVANGDDITAHYHDDECEGFPVDVYDTATADCAGPVISNVAAVNITGFGASITWLTDEMADGLVTYGTVVPPGGTSFNPVFFTSHQINLSGLTADTTYYYSVTCSDGAGNSTTDNNGGAYYSFHTSANAPVLVIDDDSSSAATIAARLTSAGYLVTEETAAATDSATWPNYLFVVWSSGDNQSPVAVASYRTAMEAHVAAGRKLWIEGGETGYDAISSPGYASFAAAVLHATTWNADSSGNLTSAAAGHPLLTTPNALSFPITCGYTAFGHQDAVMAAGDADRICSWSSYTASASMIAYDVNGDPDDGGQIVYTSFDFSMMATASQAPMAENIAAFLSAAAN